MDRREMEARLGPYKYWALALATDSLSVIKAALAVPGVTPASLCVLVRHIFGNPFRTAKIDPAWLQWEGGTVQIVARTICTDGTFYELPVLADALEDAGSSDSELLSNLRSPRAHCCGCWALAEVLAARL